MKFNFLACGPYYSLHMAYRDTVDEAKMKILLIMLDKSNGRGLLCLMTKMSG